MRLIHSCADGLHVDLVLGDGVDQSSPTGRSVTFQGREHRLGGGLEKLVGSHVLSPEPCNYQVLLSVL